MAPNKAGRVPNTRGLGSDTTPHHHLRQVKVWRSQIYRSWSRLWSGIKRIVQTGKSWFSFTRRPVGEISISYPIYHIYSYLLHITYQCSRFYIYIFHVSPAPRLVQLLVASTSLVSTLLSHDIWIIVVKFMIRLNQIHSQPLQTRNLFGALMCNTSGLDGDVEGELSQWHPRFGTLHDGNT